MADKDQKTINQVYAGFVVSLLFGFIPNVAAAFVSMALFLCLFIAAYVYRAKAEEKSLLDNHMTFIIRTMWITSLIATIAIAVAVMYMLANLDPTAVLDCVSGSVAPDLTSVEPCLDRFIDENWNIFIGSTAIAAGPTVLYLVYRLAKGINRARQGYRVANEKSWL